MGSNKELLFEIESWLNENYSQENLENYNIFNGPKLGVIRYNEKTAISFWGCGAIVCIGHLLFFIDEDDGNWSCSKSFQGDDTITGLLDSFSIAWAPGFVEAIQNLIEYVNKNGKPIYYSGTDVICNYTLDSNNEE